MDRGIPTVGGGGRYQGCGDEWIPTVGSGVKPRLWCGDGPIPIVRLGVDTKAVV